MNLGSYDDSDVDHILILLINDEGMARKVSKWLDPNYLVDYMHATPWQFVIWVSLRQLLEGATEFPSKEYLQRMVFNTALRMYGDESVAKDAADAVQAIHGITPMFEIANERLTYLYKTCVESPNVQAAVADMNMNQDISDLLERVQQLRNDGLVALAGDESRQQLGAFDILDIMDDEGSMELAEQAAESARIPTGIPYIDTLHGGKGIYKGYVTMILGPSAGGKTITGCELASQLAAQGRSVGIFGTEENAVKSIEMRARLYAAGTQVSVADWMKAGCHPKMLPDVKPGTPEYDIVIKCLQAMRRQLSLYDIGDNVSWQSIVGNIEGYAARHQGKMHDVVIIDWAGPLAEAMVVEKEAENVLAIDGITHELIGCIRNVGFQPHTSVFSPDAKFMYIIARDGWLTKINLETLEPVRSVSVGKNSRGTALTKDGKYLAIGNYEPGNVVIVDPNSLDILATIDLSGEIDGKEIMSRAGGIVENKDKIIVTLKDLASIWVIDTSKKDFPVVEKYWNIGGDKTPLHDAFLTPDGRFFIVASMGSKIVWVLDTDSWKPIGEIMTGETPHTGPGATWGDNIYVPALGEGLITVIDTKEWKPVKYIKTGG